MNCYRTASITDKEAEDTGIDVTEYPFTALDEAKVYRQFKPGMDAPRLPNCPEVFDKLSIDWNGDVTMCCADYDGEMVIGNVLNDNLQDLWVSEEADNIRKTIVSGKHFEKFKICKNCFDLGCY
jgi:radical SAM protein with 4Fe4S-binding SPASM domain